MNYVDALKLFGVEAKEIPCIKGNGAPPDTEGAVGCLYMDTDSGEMYKCVSVGVWEKFVGEYDAYPSKTQTGAVVYTDVGADNIPLKQLYVNRASGSAVSSITIRRLGKNLFDPAETSFEVGYYIDENGEIMPNPNYAHSKAFTPVLPNENYVFSGRVVGTKTVNSVAFYDANGAFLGRYTPKKANGAVSPNTPAQFTTPSECRFIRYNASYNVFEYDDVQLEVGTTATDFESYTPMDFKVVFNGAVAYRSVDVLRGTGLDTSMKTITFDPQIVTTKRGANYFYVVDSTKDTLNASLRIDPTLMYNKLNAAIVAAGIN